MNPSHWYVRGLTLQQRLSKEQLDELREIGRLQRWGHRAQIRANGPDHVVVVLKGSVDLVDPNRSRGLPRLKPGDIFGNLEYRDRLLKAYAYDETTLCWVDRSTFEEVTTGYLGTFDASFRQGLKRLALEVPVDWLLFTSPRRRVARVLTHLAETYGDFQGDEAHLPVSVRPRQISRLTGIVEERTKEALIGLERDEVIKAGRTELIIPSVEKIRELTLKP